MFLLGMLSACLASGCKEEEPFRVILKPDPSSKECASCHEAVYHEWVDSPHGKSWTRKAFQESLVHTNTDVCQGCHAPRPIYLTDSAPPDPRKVHVPEGVNCVSCHATGCPHLGTTAGSRGASTRAAWKRDSVRLCGSCHRDTYEEWKGYSFKRSASKTCPDCHMPRLSRSPPLRGPVEGGGGAEGEQRYSNHAFKPLYSESVTLEVTGVYRRESGGLEVGIELHNRTAGHGIPTGHYGYREVRLDVWLGDLGSGEVLSKRFFIEMGTSLQPGRNGPFRFYFEGEGDVLHARVVRVGMSGEELGVLGNYESELEIREHQ